MNEVELAAGSVTKSWAELDALLDGAEASVREVDAWLALDASS